MENINLPTGFTRLTGDDRLRVVLEIWMHQWLTDPLVRNYTHARAEFEVGMNTVSSVQWKLLKADDNSVYEEREITLGALSSVSVAAMVQPYMHPNGTRGRLTFRFHPAAVSLDIFDGSNSTVVAEYIVDIEVEQRVQEKLFIELDRG